MLPMLALSRPALGREQGEGYRSRGCSLELSLSVPGTPALKAPSFLGSLPFRLRVNPFLYSALQPLPLARSKCLWPSQPSSPNGSQSSLPHQLSGTLSMSLSLQGAKAPLSPGQTLRCLPLVWRLALSRQSPPLPGVHPLLMYDGLALCLLAAQSHQHITVQRPSMQGTQQMSTILEWPGCILLGVGHRRPELGSWQAPL